MRSVPVTPCTPSSPLGENPLTRRGRLLLNCNASNDNQDNDSDYNKYGKPAPMLQRFISQSTSNVIKCVVVISLILNLISIPSLFAVVFGPLLTKDSGVCTSGGELTNVVCLPCGENGIPGVRSTRTENDFCCARSSDPQLQPLLQRKLIQTSPHLGRLYNPECEPFEKDLNQNGAGQENKSGTLKTFGRLILDVKGTKNENRFKWQKTSPNGWAFIHGDLTYRNRSFHVLRDGIYRVHTHLSFDSCINALPRPNIPHIITHMLVRQRLRHDKIIMVNKVTITHEIYQSSDLDLAVNLHANDSLRVAIDTFRFLFDWNIANSFEIQRIG